jgi:hypothetical protein
MVSGMTGGMTAAVAAALATIKDRPADAGAVALCRYYAELIDSAAPAARYREPLRLLMLAADDAGEDAGKAFQKVADALAAHSVASDLGPKLLAALGALGLTLAGRGVKGGTGDSAPAVKPLDQLRERRARKSRTPTMDTATS